MEGMEKQLTAVEFAFEELNKWRIENFGEGALIGIPQEVLDKAKEMEKEQIIEAHGDKKRTKSNSGSCVTYSYTFTGEMYYNETFKSE
jgi:hypothetical protein